MIELGMALGASVAWGASDFVAGVAARRRSLLLVLGGSQLTGLLLMGCSAAVAGVAAPTTGAVLLAAGAGLCEVGGFALLYRALSSGPMGPVAPIAALGGVVPLGVHLIEGGAVSTLALIGLLIALVGIALVSWEPRDGDDGDGEARGGGGDVRVDVDMQAVDHEGCGGERSREKVSPRALVYAAGSAVAFGTFFLLLERATDATGDPVTAVTVSRLFAVAVTLPLLALALRRRTPGPGDLRDLLVIAAVGVLDIGANTLYAVGASEPGHDGSLAVIASTYPVATVVLAGLVLRERMSLLQAAGAVLTLGAVLMVGSV